MLTRVILHIDINCFYASVEASEDPTLRGKPLAVCGDPIMRHGIVLTKSYEAKPFGVQTGMAVWEARKLCPPLIVKIARYEKYLAYKDRVFDIIREYTPLFEPYGCDEGWAEITGRGVTLEDGRRLADTIRRRLWDELGLPSSVGVSFTKTFAKLGSDYKKPNATTVITPENNKDIVWLLPVGDLLFIGPRSVQKLKHYGITTIGQLAQASPEFGTHLFGVIGLRHLAAANGLDDYPVRPDGDHDANKSIGNSLTFSHDLKTMDDVSAGCYMLAESVAARLRAQGSVSSCVAFGLRDAKLNGASCQRALRLPTALSGEIARTAFALFSGGS
jgi:DNA polymerase-4